MVTQLDWNDGSNEKLYLTYGSSDGTQTIAISSDPNVGYTTRTRDIVFQVSTGSATIQRTLTVSQTGKDIIIITRNNTSVTRNDVALGYEQ